VGLCGLISAVSSHGHATSYNGNGSAGKEQFGDAELGDARRVERLIRIARRASETPGGKVSHVFSTAREPDGPYNRGPTHFCV
jgi:hypothetical protein